ncbi:MAG: FKBP-type peptidyl-prolyl cis-trans isomerase [Candidatus Pacebacteria bacterium]|nr:FKBP-type peptidyl-prolyl cis-trans isomerase [Candidatus Paceibacterota bacterium]
MDKVILIIGILVVVVGSLILIQYSNQNKNESLSGNALDSIEPIDIVIEDQEQNKEQENNQKQDLEIEILQQGSGEQAKTGDRLAVHYTGWLLDGVKFDSSVDRGEPFVFPLDQGLVIKGWDLGLLGAKVGEKRKLTIPCELGYGEAGTPGGPIPPNATLIFEVEILGINQ